MSPRDALGILRTTTLALVLLLAARATLRAADARYPETADGLKKLTQDMIAAAQGGKAEAAAVLAKGMLLPDHETWFKKTFGEAKGKALADDYGRMAKSFDQEIPQLFAQQVKQGRTEVTAYKLSGPDDPNATGLQRSALEAMKQKTALYGVRLVEPGKPAGFHLWSFVYVDGAFRLAGKMRMAP